MELPGMKMLDEPFLRRVEAAVDRVEAGSSVEMVVAITPCSGNYADVNLAFGAGLALVFLGLALLLPVTFHESWVLPNTVVAGLLGWFCCSRLPSLRRLLTPSARQRRQVEDGARVAFLREGVDATRDRTGILFYLSIDEQDLEVVADHGVEGAVPRARFNELRHRVVEGKDGTLLTRFLEVLEQSADILADRLPAAPGTTHSIPNKPRILS